MHVHTDTACSSSVGFYTHYKVQSVPETQVHLLTPQAIQSPTLSSPRTACIITQSSDTNHLELKKKTQHKTQQQHSGLFTACPTLYSSDNEKEYSDSFCKEFRYLIPTDFFLGSTFECSQS